MKITNIFIFLLLVLISCHSPAKTNKNTAVKYLHVSVDIPDNLLIEVRTNFRSIPTWWGCKCLSESDWNWVPLEKRNEIFISKTDKEKVIPLFETTATICKWILYSAEIGIVNKKDSSGIAGVRIYSNSDSSTYKKREMLVDTLRYESQRWTNQFISPQKIHLNCIRLDCKNEDPSYTFKGIHHDTAHVTIIIQDNTSSIQYMDTTMKVPFKFRYFGKNEKIPGVNEGREK